MTEHPPWIRWALIAASTVAVLAVSALTYVLVGGGTGTTAQPAATGDVASPAAQRLRIVGYLTLQRGQFTWDTKPVDWCQGWLGYNDIKIGTVVTVTDASGTTIALGELDSAVPYREPLDETKARMCRLHFEVRAPAGHEFYGIEIGSRGRVQYTVEQINKGLELTIG